jgi:hypothetical protein
VAILADYNNGHLNGEWIDAAQEPEDLLAAVDQLLRKSRYPNVTRQDYECNECKCSYHRDVVPGEPKAAACPECDEPGPRVGEPYRSAEE